MRPAIGDSERKAERNYDQTEAKVSDVEEGRRDQGRRRNLYGAALLVDYEARRGIRNLRQIPPPHQTCEASDVISIVYTLINSTTLAPNFVTVSNCWVHDCGTPEYHDIDNNAIGIQGGSFHLLTKNSFSNCGPAIILWTSNVDMKSNIISLNYIANGNTNPSGTSGGIAISGDNASATFGRRAGCMVYGNIIANMSLGSGLAWQGTGISGNLPDYIEIFNNTISGGSRGIDIEVSHAGYSVNARVVNNIIVNPSVYYYYLAAPNTPTNLVVDFNLYYPDSTVAGHSVINPNNPAGHDSNSVFATASFVSATPAVANDYKLSAGSAAIGAGTNLTAVGGTVDFASNPRPASGNWDIGAFEFVPPPGTVVNTILSGNMKLQGNIRFNQ
jgi:hypothetical protein